MRFNIKECELYGIRRPYLFFSGWVEQKAMKLFIKLDNIVCYEIEFDNTKSRIHSFSFRTELPSKGWVNEYRVFVVDEKGIEYFIYQFKSNPYSRFNQKLKKDKFDLSTRFLDKYKYLFNETYNLKNEESYAKWIQEHERFTEIYEHKYTPLISIIIPVYNVERKYLSKCLDSILKQTYQNFEVCLADDCSPSLETRETLKEYAAKDSRIKVLFREKNGHISEATNSALTLATGEFIAMMDNDDELMPQALNEIVYVLNQNKDLDFIYTDEDKIDLEGNRSDPQFKPDLAIDKLYGGNYICHFNVIRKSIMDQVGGFRKGYEGAQDFDLFIRILEITKKFHHIPKVLYHWRMIPGSTALDAGSKNYAGEAGKRALEDLFAKKQKNVQVDIVVNTHYSVEYVEEENYKVNIVMVISEINDLLKHNILNITKDLSFQNIFFTFVCPDVEKLEQVLKQMDIAYECVLFVDSLAQSLNQTIIKNDCKYILVLNELANIETFDAIELMAGYAAQEEMGAIGTKVLNAHKYVADSGYFILNEKLLPAYFATYANDYGHYGNLLVTNNYRIIEDTCFMFSKKTFLDLNGFSSIVPDSMIYYDFCLRAHVQGKRNVIVPRVEVSVMKTEIRKDEEQLPLKVWASYGVDLINDEFYNVNLSKRIAFRLEK